MSAVDAQNTQSKRPVAPKLLDPAAANAAAASFAVLEAQLGYLNETDTDMVRRAYKFADEAHLGQMRKSGEPYITHPIAVAGLCTEWKLDAQALAAALLHDAMEDCGVTKIELIERFGSPVAELVDGLTKLDKLEFNTREENQAESFRKMLLAMARDVRVILIKLADRTHNMRTMSDMPRSKWGRIASETLEIYAPIAHRLGLNQIYRELQDLSFKHLLPWRYAVLSKAVSRARNRRRDLIQKVQNDVEAVFAQSKLEVRISGREKTLYSIYKKMDEKHLSFAQVTDIYGLRVIVPSVIDCYTALGLLHQIYKPVPGKFKDHIAIAKVNGYQSLHTTLGGAFGCERGVSNAHRGHALGGRIGCGGALALQRTRVGQRPIGALGNAVVAIAARHSKRNPRCRRILGPRQGRPVPRCRLCLHTQEPDHGLCHAGPRWSTLRTPSTAEWVTMRWPPASMVTKCPCAPNSKTVMWSR
jgi:GTP diphosphokinase / guanosine-3',5'-bis(diphosphate) 3'-diphosphatase